jgi:hypothetical protein
MWKIYEIFWEYACLLLTKLKIDIQKYSYKWTIMKKVMILSTSQNFIKTISKIRGPQPLGPSPKSALGLHIRNTSSVNI